MAKNTNFQNLKALLEDYKPETQGFLTKEECSLVRETLEIDSMKIIELRNLRDFVVMYLSNLKDDTPGSLMETMNKMSGITAVIDQAIVEKGGEV